MKDLRVGISVKTQGLFNGLDRDIKDGQDMVVEDI